MKITAYDPKSIILDGRMDEPIWETAEEYTGFKRLGAAGIPVEKNNTSFKILPFEDRIIVGVKCMDDDMDGVTKLADGTFDNVNAVEVFFSLSGNPYDFYQFFVSINGSCEARYWEEFGKIKPDPYAPVWNTAVYKGENYWSVEMELPFTAFYMTPQMRWSDKWLVNVARTRISRFHEKAYSTWSTLNRGFICPECYTPMEGFPLRDARNDLYISSVLADITEHTDGVYRGVMKVLARVAEAGVYTFTSDHSDPVTVSLEAGMNEFTAPCYFPELTRYKVQVALTRQADGTVFPRSYPVLVAYEPIAIKFTQPEFRTNFYPGQDHTKIVGKVTSAKPVTLTLEGPGIPKQVLSPDAEGNFVFETPDFEEGDAIFTATDGSYETVRKIRNLPPTGHMMTWISGGNLIVNGKPVLRRNMYAEYYAGGEAFKRRYDADDLHQTKEICMQTGHMEPGRLIKGSEAPNGEAFQDARPSDEMLALVDGIMDANKDKDFAFYYISDEPECRGLSKIYLTHLYNHITERDPYHVVLTASRNASELVDIADWFETHPYINPYTNAEGKRIYSHKICNLGKFVDDIIKLDRTDKCIGFLPTCFAGMSSKPQPYPTLDEYICHTWAPMLRGGKTLYPYAYHDLNDRASLYEGTRYIFSSFEALDQFILLAKRTVLVKTPEVESVLYELEGEKMFVLVNMTHETQQVTLEGISGTWHEFRHNRQITGNTFTLKPLEVVIGTSEVKDAGLPTYEETAALIDKLEYERTHTGSLLFERKADIDVTTSGAVGWARKLFDGIRDNYAWGQVGDKEKFYELGLTKVKACFDKVVVSGFNIEDMELKVRVNGELTVPAIKEVFTEEFSKTFILEEKICPDALRLEMKARRVELYEIEVF